ncbi:MAG: helix-turn-helix domain-containing protein [Bacteroidota bacterium]
MKQLDLKKCPLTAALKIVGGKWKPIIILNLGKSTSPRRFGQLDYMIPDISRKVLTSHLSEMIEDGLIIRTPYPETPPRVEYSLTDKGKELVTIFGSLADWGRYLVD